jgi:hypothetical protein
VGVSVNSALSLSQLLIQLWLPTTDSFPQEEDQRLDLIYSGYDKFLISMFFQFVGLAAKKFKAIKKVNRLPIGCQGVHKLAYFCLIFLNFTSYPLIFPNDEILSSLIRIRLPFLIFTTADFTQDFFTFFSYIDESLDLIADNNYAEFIVHLPISCVFVFGFQLLQPL